MKYILAVLLILSSVGFAQATTKSSATLKQAVNPNPAIAAKVTLTSSANPSTIGQNVTYSGSVTGTNNGASPTGTVIVTGAMGSQVISLTPTGTFTCTETITKAGSFTVTATYQGDSNFF